MIRTFLRAALCSLPGALTPVAAMEPLDDQHMADVVARQGISVDLAFHWNLQWSGGVITPIACPTAPLPSASFGDCRLALQFNDRADTWLVLKDYYGLFEVDGLFLDATVTPETASGLCDADCLARWPTGISPYNRPAVQFSYDRTGITDSTAYYGDALYFLNASRVTAEFGPQGYLDDTVSGSAIGLRMADGPNGINGPAQIRFDGQMLMSGY